MKILTRLTCLLTAAVSLGLMGALALEQIEYERVHTVNMRMQQHFSAQARQLFHLKSRNLRSYANDNAYWDELVQFLQTRDRKWIYQNMITSFPYHQVDAVWVYNAQQQPVYAYFQGQGTPLAPSPQTPLPVARAALPTIFQALAQKRQISFWAELPDGVWEISAATIHSNQVGKNHQDPPQGYLIVGRRWSTTYLTELGQMIGASVTLAPAPTLPPQNQPRSRTGQLVEHFILSDWQQKPLRQVTFASQEPLLFQLERFATLRGIILTSGGVAILVGFPLLLLIWVGKPLRKLGQSLSTGDITPLQILRTRDHEFGSLARLIEQFFIQKEKLLQEVTERQRIETVLRDNHDRYALAVQGANDGLWVWDLQTDQAYFSPRWRTMLGLPADTEFEDSHPQTWFDRIHPNDYERIRKEIDHHLAGVTPYLEHEHRLRVADGSYRWMLCRGLAVRDSAGKPYRIAGSLTDLTHRKVLYDPLTKLPNRTLFLERLQQELAFNQRQPETAFAVMFLDLDRFKSVNDSLGHLAGDQLLIEIARRFKEVIRPSDTIARLGGDEFALLLHDVGDVHGAIQVALRLQRQMERSIILEGQEIFSGTSIGIVLNQPDRHLIPEDLIRSADAAMYRAKSLGRGRYQVFDANMYQSSQERLHLESWLHHAVERQELRLHYQPIVSVQTSQIEGFEALVRWQHPQRGLISPADFIPIAEDTGLISAIGRWVLSSACQQLADWQQQFPHLPHLSVSVNLSGRQFVEADLAYQISEVLRQSGLSPRRLKLEVTEATLIKNPEAAAKTLQQLKATGVKIELDDFGTGYCSLSYLHNFAIDALKIDRSFIQDLTHSQKHYVIVKTLVGLAHSLGIDAVAEGVEQESQRDELQRLGCEYAQGFFFSKPLTVEAATTWLSQSSQLLASSY
jgi:diguanylate cyclase (GGDEF)-like protein/PAS domain S-box-containing protein